MSGKPKGPTLLNSPLCVLVTEDIRKQIDALAFKQSSPGKPVRTSDIIRQALAIGLLKLGEGE